MTKRRAVFLDRDGTISENRSDYVKSWDEFVFLSRTHEAMKQIAASDFLVIVTTNQSVVSRGLVDNQVVREIHVRMKDSIERAGGRIDAVYFCPHKPEDRCDCRKPKPGMYQQAAARFDIDFARSYVMGDALEDVQAANSIGATPILVLTGRGSEHQKRLRENDGLRYQVVEDLLDAMEWISQREKLSG